MNRYLYYLIIVNMIVHIVASVPKILYESKASGSINSMLMATVVGIVLIYCTINFFNKFPRKGYPELLKQYIPSWISIPMLVCMGLFWYSIGLKTLITNVHLMKRFLTPNMPIIWITITLLLFTSFGLLMKSKSILYTLEIILILNLPLLLFIIGKLYTNKEIEWDFIGESLMHFYEPPNYSAFSASLFFFFGVINLAVFNREFKHRQKMKAFQLFLIGASGAGFLFTSYLIPIGYNGFDTINHIAYPWMITTDSIKVGFAFLERVMFVFLIGYMSIAFLSVIITWHVGLELLKSAVSGWKLKWRDFNLIPYFFLLFFWIASIRIALHINENELTLYSGTLFKMAPPFFVIFIIVGWYLSRRSKT